MCIILITPTGGRPDQINLCHFFMKRQTYPGKVVWIIVDDCNPHTIDGIQNDKENWNIIKIFPSPPWQPGQNTQGRNIAEGINTLLANYKSEEIEGIFIIEDDDYYKPIYLERMASRLSGFQAIGEKNTIYYNVFYRTSFTHDNNGHSSLFQTAFTMEALLIFENCLNQRFIDMAFRPALSRVNLFNDGNLSIGIKGMPGRYGIGSGHTRLRNMPADNGLNYLISLIGNENAQLYAGYYGGSQIQRHSLFTRRN